MKTRLSVALSVKGTRTSAPCDNTTANSPDGRITFRLTVDKTLDAYELIP